MLGDASSPLDRAARELHPDRMRQIRDERLVGGGTAVRVSFPAPLPHLTVGQIFLLGLLDGTRLGEDACRSWRSRVSCAKWDESARGG